MHSVGSFGLVKLLMESRLCSSEARTLLSCAYLLHVRLSSRCNVGQWACWPDSSCAMTKQSSSLSWGQLNKYTFSLRKISWLGFGPRGALKAFRLGVATICVGSDSCRIEEKILMSCQVNPFTKRIRILSILAQSTYKHVDLFIIRSIHLINASFQVMFALIYLDLITC